MPYVIQTFDKPGHADIRTANRRVHLDYLEKHKGKLLAAGAVLNDDGSTGEGGVLIVDTEERQAAEEFIANDPFTKAGLFAKVTVTRWRKAFFNFQNCL
jgi:uncharacterized protein YciI